MEGFLCCFRHDTTKNVAFRAILFRAISYFAELFSRNSIFFAQFHFSRNYFSVLSIMAPHPKKHSLIDDEASATDASGSDEPNEYDSQDSFIDNGESTEEPRKKKIKTGSPLNPAKSTPSQEAAGSLTIKAIVQSSEDDPDKQVVTNARCFCRLQPAIHRIHKAGSNFVDHMLLTCPLPQQIQCKFWIPSKLPKSLNRSRSRV